MARQHLLDDFGHAVQRPLFEALGQADDRDPRSNKRRRLLENLTKSVRRHPHDHDVSRCDRIFEIVGGTKTLRQRTAFQVRRVSVLMLDLGCNVAIAGP